MYFLFWQLFSLSLSLSLALYRCHFFCVVNFVFLLFDLVRCTDFFSFLFLFSAAFPFLFDDILHALVLFHLCWVVFRSVVFVTVDAVRTICVCVWKIGKAKPKLNHRQDVQDDVEILCKKYCWIKERRKRKKKFKMCEFSHVNFMVILIITTIFGAILIRLWDIFHINFINSFYTCAIVSIALSKRSYLSFGTAHATKTHSAQLYLSGKCVLDTFLSRLFFWWF